MNRKRLALLGIVLIALGALGPFTFADDVRHLGEMALSVGLLVSGLCLLVPVLPVQGRCNGSFPIAAPVVLVGLFAGTLLDRPMAGLLLGIGLGLAWVGLRCSRLGPEAGFANGRAQAERPSEPEHG